MKIRNCRAFWSLVAVFFCILSAYGCNRSSAPPPNPLGQSQAAQPVQPVQPVQPPPPPAPGGPRPQFLDFPDIPIPSELDLRSGDSYVVQAGGVKTGILTLRGRVDINSLINFFTLALPREGWKPKGMFRYRRSALIFEKPEKTCVILLSEGTVYTYVEIYVAPVS